MGNAAKDMTEWKVLHFKNHMMFLKREAKWKGKGGQEERKSRAQPYSRTDNWHSRKTSRRLSSPSRRLSAGPLPKFLRPLWTTKRGGMFGQLSGKRHFRAHSCHSPGTWILPQRVQWWRAGRGRYAFYLKMASCERMWNQNWLLWYSPAHTAPLLLSAPSSHNHSSHRWFSHTFCPSAAPRTFSSSFFSPPKKGLSLPQLELTNVSLWWPHKACSFPSSVVSDGQQILISLQGSPAEWPGHKTFTKTFIHLSVFSL